MLFRGQIWLGCIFSSVSYKKKLCLYGSDCQHTIVQLSLIRTSNNECIHMCQRLPDFTQNHPISIRISSPTVFSHVPLVFLFLFSLPVPCQPLPFRLIKGRPALFLVEQKLCNVVPKSGWFISGIDWLFKRPLPAQSDGLSWTKRLSCSECLTKRSS